MNAILLFLIGATVVGIWSHSKDRPVPRIAIAAGTLVLVALLSTLRAY